MSTCDTCRFWDQLEGEHKRGWCRRVSPTLTVKPFRRPDADRSHPHDMYAWRYTGWPETRPVDWCGEWRERVA